MKGPELALANIDVARRGATLRDKEWDLISEYLVALIDRGIGEPAELADRLERRGRTAEFYDVMDNAVLFPAGGRRQEDKA